MASTPNTSHSIRQLPARPSLEHLKNEAKQHLQRLRSEKPDAKLSEAQTEIARSYGFSSWRALRSKVEPRKVDIRNLTALIQVYDMPTSIAFYRDVLGFGIVEASRATGDGWQPESKRSSSDDRFDWVMLRLKTLTLMLNTAYETHARPACPEPARNRAHGDTIIFFFMCGSVDDAFGYLRSKGVETEEPFTQSYGMKQLYLKDPDGYGICFQERI